MFTLYGFDTANTIKVALLLEELQADYTVHPVNIRAGANRSPAFLSVSPLGKIPVLVDRSDLDAPVTISESAAILIYLAEKSGAYLATGGPTRAATLQWLMVQAASGGPIFGQSEYWRHLAPEANEAAIERYDDLSSRLLDEFDRHLAGNLYFAGSDYSIADMAHFGWLSRRHKAGLHIAERQHLRRWYDAIDQRPEARRAIKMLYSLPGAGSANRQDRLRR